MAEGSVKLSRLQNTRLSHGDTCDSDICDILNIPVKCLVVILQIPINQMNDLHLFFSIHSIGDIE